MTRKNKIQSNLRTYILRREALRANYPDWKLGNPKYVKKNYRLYRTIANFRRKLRRIEKWEQYLFFMDRIVCEFMDLEQIRFTVESQERTLVVARFMFCKYAIEQYSIPGWLVSEFLGAKDSVYANRSRLKFTRSFKINKSGHETWQRFKQYIHFEIQDKAA